MDVTGFYDVVPVCTAEGCTGIPGSGSGTGSGTGNGSSGSGSDDDFPDSSNLVFSLQNIVSTSINLSKQTNLNSLQDNKAECQCVPILSLDDATSEISSWSCGYPTQDAEQIIY